MRLYLKLFMCTKSSEGNLNHILPRLWDIAGFHPNFGDVRFGLDWRCWGSEVNQLACYMTTIFNITDRRRDTQTTYDCNTALCISAHRAVWISHNIVDENVVRDIRVKMNNQHTDFSFLKPLRDHNQRLKQFPKLSNDFGAKPNYGVMPFYCGGVYIHLAATAGAIITLRKLLITVFIQIINYI